MVFALFLLSLFLVFSFALSSYFSLLFSCSYSSLSSFVFVLFLFSSRKTWTETETPNPAPHCRWTTPLDNLPPDNPPPDNPPPDRPKFRSFFPSSCHKFHSSFSLLGSFRWIFLAPEPWNVHIWALGLSCETPAAPPDRAAGARTRQPENSKRAHFTAPALQTPPKFHERTPRERKKKETCGGKREEKARNFGLPTLRASTLRGLHPSGPPPFGASTLRGPTLRGRFGQSRPIRMAKVGLAKVGLSHLDRSQWDAATSWTDSDVPCALCGTMPATQTPRLRLCFGRQDCEPVTRPNPPVNSILNCGALLLLGILSDHSSTHSARLDEGGLTCVWLRRECGSIHFCRDRHVQSCKSFLVWVDHGDHVAKPSDHVICAPGLTQHRPNSPHPVTPGQRETPLVAMFPTPHLHLRRCSPFRTEPHLRSGKVGVIILHRFSGNVKSDGQWAQWNTACVVTNRVQKKNLSSGHLWNKNTETTHLLQICVQRNYCLFELTVPKLLVTFDIIRKSDKHFWEENYAEPV